MRGEMRCPECKSKDVECIDTTAEHTPNFWVVHICSRWSQPHRCGLGVPVTATRSLLLRRLCSSSLPATQTCHIRCPRHERVPENTG